MKYETIKAKAKALYSTGIDNWPNKTFCISPYLRKGSPSTFEALMPFINATKGEREEMRVFAEGFEAKRGDWIALTAKAPDQRLDVAWAQVVLRAREAGLQLIDNWDVRMVSKLIEIFPDSVPASYRGKQLTCYMADNPDCDWMVEVSQPVHGDDSVLEPSSPSMGM